MPTKIPLEHMYVFRAHYRDALGKNSESLYQKMSQWLENTFEPEDYFAGSYVTHTLSSNFTEYVIAFFEQKHYNLFAMCWKSQMDDYHKSYEVKV